MQCVCLWLRGSKCRVNAADLMRLIFSTPAAGLLTETLSDISQASKPCYAPVSVHGFSLTKTLIIALGRTPFMYLSAHFCVLFLLAIKLNQEDF